MSWDSPAFREPVSACSHVFGLAAALAGTAVLWRRGRGDRPKQFALLIFGLSMCILFAASSLYHAVQGPPERLLFYRKLDHAAIYVLIAGTNTPIYFTFWRGWRGWAVPLVLWTLAALGVSATFLFLLFPERATNLIYLGMGWGGAVGYFWAASMLSFRKTIWVLGGGVLYTVGIILDYCHWPVIVPGVLGPHEVFHLFVLGGSAMFYLFVLFHVVPFRRNA